MPVPFSPVKREGCSNQPFFACPHLHRRFSVSTSKRILQK
ncbi:hypothetical protein AB434_2008 [Heyndrickxia coagulans]|uniref:Uncharacterized protein n=1 Tax=Heyndrickxia coagulans TaxID=1398 RepID=A0AAN0WDF1_HEYCO|nr:hypothetical protein SB48_HM08orf05298 [Heyndrickxia coagulans]AKN54413.1 hypothetical protein AB434_2008 [Heyndrickxia coagulans]